MPKISKKILVEQIIRGAQDYSANVLLFKQAVGQALKLTAVDIQCLGLILHKGFATPSELSNYTSLSSGATTAMLDRLEKVKLIERHRNPHDRRSVHIVVTKKTAQTVQPLFSSMLEAQATLAATYSEKDLQLLVGFFGKSIDMWKKEQEKLRLELRRIEKK